MTAKDLEKLLENTISFIKIEKLAQESCLETVKWEKAQWSKKIKWSQ